MGGFSRPFGTGATANADPAVNCRAIIKSPSGRETERNVQAPTAASRRPNQRQRDAGQTRRRDACATGPFMESLDLFLKRIGPMNRAMFGVHALACRAPQHPEGVDTEPAVHGERGVR